MTANQPLVSVAMPAYNAEAYIREAIESILNQTYSNFELLIQDDGSTDGTLDVVASIDDPRISVRRSECNMGPGAVRNALMARAKGKYLAAMDADDISEPNRLQIQVDFMERNPDISMCGANIMFIDENGVPKNAYSSYPLTHDHIRARLLIGSIFAHPTVMMRLDDMRNNGLDYGNVRRTAEDMYCWTKVVDMVRCANLPNRLLRYRVWSNQMSTGDNEGQVKDALKVHSDRIARLGIVLSESGELFARAFLRRNSTLNRAEVAQVEQLIINIYKANKQRKEYDNVALRCELLKFYKNIYKKVVHSRIKVIAKKMTLTLRLLLIR